MLFYVSRKTHVNLSSGLPQGGLDILRNALLAMMIYGWHEKTEITDIFQGSQRKGLNTLWDLSCNPARRCKINCNLANGSAVNEKI